MADITSILIRALIILLVFIISSIPLYLSVKVLRGKTSLLKAMLITLISGIIVTAIEFKFKVWGGLIAFLILIVIYRESFRLKWLKALLVWLLQLIFIAIIVFILSLLNILSLEVFLILN